MNRSEIPRSSSKPTSASRVFLCVRGSVFHSFKNPNLVSRIADELDIEVRDRVAEVMNQFMEVSRLWKSSHHFGYWPTVRLQFIQGSQRDLSDKLLPGEHEKAEH
jgi:hypothetical protein